MTGEETPAICSEATASALEFPSLLAMVSHLAATDLGRDEVLALRPFTDLERLATRRRCVGEVSLALEERTLVPAFDEPLGPLLDALTVGASREIVGTDFLQLADLLTASTEAARFILAFPERFPGLARSSEPLPPVTELLRRIRKTFDARGELREDASTRLKGLRAFTRRHRDGLYRRLTGYIQQHREQLADETVSLRGGRLSVLLPSGGRGRLAGLTHGRSATAKSYYFEPLEFVEANNELQQAVDDEEAECRRILVELEREVRKNLVALQEHAEFIAFLDLLQASHRFGEAAGGRLVDIEPEEGLELVGARHPLLDPGLADLRRRALDQVGHTDAVVPLDLELSRGQRALVVTGPNAGGKTVALKTLGLLVLAAQCGLPIPVASGTRLPWIDRLMALVGDEQDLLRDRSTFSARLLRLKEAWESASPHSLVLLDELGSGTNPEEGTALSIALLEGLVKRKSLAFITTHLTQVAVTALELPGASCAAMEFDPKTSQPTFRLIPGPPGGSEALALARRLGLAAEWLDRAESYLGSEHRDLRRLLAEVEKVRRELLAARSEAEAERAGASQLRQRLAEEHRGLEADRKSLARGLKAELESFRRKTYERLKSEVERLSRELQEGRRRGLAEEALGRLFSEAPVPVVDENETAGAVEVGQQVRHIHQGWNGQLEKLGRGRAEVRVQGKRVKCHQADLIRIEAETPVVPRPVVFSRPDEESSQAQEINLIGQRVEPALEALDVYLDKALLSGLPQVRVVHGHGSGRLRGAVRDYLSSHPAVAGHASAPRNQGGDGATLVTLKGD